jgi:CheY-like chemotaxis protein
VHRDLTILIAEDDEDYRMLLQAALEQNGHRVAPQLVRDGQELLDYLQGAGTYADRKTFPQPSIVFVDIKMPRLGGFEVLQWLATHQDYRVIPTLVLSSSTLDSDVVKAYHLGAYGYLAKPSSFGDLKDILDHTLKFWTRCIKPERPRTDEPI